MVALLTPASAIRSLLCRPDRSAGRSRGRRDRSCRKLLVRGPLSVVDLRQERLDHCSPYSCSRLGGAPHRRLGRAAVATARRFDERRTGYLNSARPPSHSCRCPARASYDQAPPRLRGRPRRSANGECESVQRPGHDRAHLVTETRQGLSQDIADSEKRHLIKMGIRTDCFTPRCSAAPTAAGSPRPGVGALHPYCAADLPKGSARRQQTGAAGNTAESRPVYTASRRGPAAAKCRLLCRMQSQELRFSR